MTFLDKLKQDNPNMTEEELNRTVRHSCPYVYGYGGETVNSKCMNDGRVGFHCVECWNREMPEPSCDDVKAAYDQGLNDAWELAKQILYGNDKQTAEIFDVKVEPVFFDLTHKREIINNHTPQEAREMISEWRESQLKVGDVVIQEETGIRFWIITEENDKSHKFGVINLEDVTLDRITDNSSSFKKTGKHIEIQSILEQIGDE